MSENPRHPMTDEQRDMARALGQCSFLPGSWDKRFARDMAAMAEDPDAALTRRQAETLMEVCHRYRRQIGREW